MPLTFQSLGDLRRVICRLCGQQATGRSIYRCPQLALPGRIGAVEDDTGPDAGTSAAAARVLATVGPGVLDRLAELSGSDFTSLMLEVARRRAARETPATVVRRYRNDRFVRPAQAPWQSLRRAEDVLTGNLPASYELLTLAPLVPLGTHSALATVSQDKVVTAMRACEVAADPTNALALEAAVRRLARPRDIVRLGAVQRVVRAQQTAPGYLPHFGLLGLATAGRDRGGREFERAAVAEHVRALAAGLAAAGFAPVQLALTPLSEAGESVAAAVAGELTGPVIDVITDRQRQSGRGYYRDLCYKLNVSAAGQWQEVGDGGFTDWAARLTASSKERLLISGVGIDRLAAFRSVTAIAGVVATQPDERDQPQNQPGADRVRQRMYDDDEQDRGPGQQQ